MIQRECKQCGKQFTLSDSEIKFYKSKNLAFPKRCKECRENNKNGNNQKNVGKDISVKLDEIVNSIDLQTVSPVAESVSENIRKRKYGKVLIPVILVVVAAFIIVFVKCGNSNNSTEHNSANAISIQEALLTEKCLLSKVSEIM